MKKFLLCVALVCLMTGCTIVMPSHRVVIHDQNLNSQEFNKRVQADDTVPPYVKRWMAADAQSWMWLDDLAHGRNPVAPSTQPAQ